MNNILVTGIGGVVGQGILRNIAGMQADIRLIGTNVTAVSAGNYMCDVVHEVPYAYDENYIPAILEISRKEKISLIIPSTDYESYYLALHQEKFSCPVAASPAEVTRFCLDKYLNAQAFSKFDIPFAKSFRPAEYKGQFVKTVVKPREGRGSRNIFVDPANPSTFDQNYVVQEYLEGPEITTTFYVNRHGALHGFITFVRELESGNTSKAEVVFDYNEELEGLIRKIMQHYPFRGSCNIQSRVTKNGIVPFEINCRISGTNSVRSQFGFNDVAYTVEEYLFDREPTKPKVEKGTALRVIVDIIYPHRTMKDIRNKHDDFYIH